MNELSDYYSGNEGNQSLQELLHPKKKARQRLEQGQTSDTPLLPLLGVTLSVEPNELVEWKCWNHTEPLKKKDVFPLRFNISAMRRGSLQ